MSRAAAGTIAGLPAFYRSRQHDSLPSTNDEAKRLAAAGAPEGTLVVARRQSGGRGRRGRYWDSPEGNLYCSLLLRPARSPAEAAQLSFVAALALAETLDGWLAAGRIGLKWPNDVLVDGAKIAGILLETAAAGGRVDWLVLGIGVNVAHHPRGLERPVTSLGAAGAGAVDPAEVLRRLAERLEAWYRRWLAEGFGPVRRAWLARAIGLERRFSAELPSGGVVGVFQGIDAAGALVYRGSDGGTGRIAAGEVHFAA